MRAAAREQGRVFQAQHDQHITEYHTHYHSALRAIADDGRPGPDSVRVPLTARPLSPIRDRTAVRRDLTESVTGGPEAAGTHVVYGMPGCGKTAVAQVLFDEVVRDHGVVGLWVNASHPTTFREGMLAVALDRGASQDEVDAARALRRPPADLVWHCLDRSPERWLLVLDNADDPSVLNNGWLRSSPRGTVVITTRHGQAPQWRHATGHRLDTLDVPDAVEVLRDLAPAHADRAALEEPARRLGCHPLALVLAGTFLGHQLLEPVSVDDYLRRLDDDPGPVLDQGAAPGESDLRRLVSSTWQLSLDSLRDQGLPEATTLLRLLSCYAPQPLPVGVLAQDRLSATALSDAQPPLPGVRANQALHGLLTQSLVALVEVPGDAGRPAVRSVQAHALLLDTVFARTPLDQRDTVLTAATTLLSRLLAPDTDTDGRDEGQYSEGQSTEGPYVDAQTLRLFLPHAIALLRRTVGTRSPAVHDALAITRRLRQQCHDSGDFSAAHALATAAHAATDGEHTAAALSDRYELARALAGLGRYTEAAELHRSALREREELHGPDHPSTLDSAHALGLALYGLGRFEEDELHMARAAHGRARTLGPEHPDTIESTACLAEAIGEQQRWDEAEALARPNLATSERALGREHPRTLVSRITLAWVLFRRGSTTEAEQLARAVAEGNEQQLGPGHPRTLAAGDLLAGILLQQGRWPEAEEAARAVLSARRRTLGDEHPHTLAIQTRLARIILGADRAVEARDLAEEALAAYHRVLGPDHPLTLRCRDVREEALAAATSQPHATDHPEEDLP
ncbi:ATP/GTP-binding protein [Streptomyces spinoverrucosus]|uniref:ATP/GTP-binding protein n=1 Tax=Streptomyces spinoverrucosus TaxID=284043 RepID=A0A4Y3VND7_9ACTN|nr:tetratricopeptide repeat protein [Streptomyces spinoverrucosus]GEC07190.1 ATP/GTP-binding protein [Streptomyces spinoverrucosus]GHB80869.1 ATP/GTP-binding protein [Streptomyces spinoverrucosus]